MQCRMPGARPQTKATMSMLYVAGLSKGLQNPANMSLAALGMRSISTGMLKSNAARPLAVAQTKPRNFGGPVIHPGGCTSWRY